MIKRYEVCGKTTKLILCSSKNMDEEYECLIDTDMLGEVRKYNWYPKKSRSGFTHYVQTTTTNQIFLHRFIMGTPPPGYVIDHIDGNGLNNTRKNLRVISNSENNANMNNKSKNTSSKYVNVFKHKQSGRWLAQVKLSDKKYNLGTYDLEWVAAIVAMEFKKKMYGENYIAEGLEQELYGIKADNIEEYYRCIRDSKIKRIFGRVGDSGILGVTWAKDRQKWRATIYMDGKPKCLGQYTDKYEAGRAVTRGILKHMGSEYVIRTPIIL